VYTTAYISLTA